RGDVTGVPVTANGLALGGAVTDLSFLVLAHDGRDALTVLVEALLECGICHNESRVTGLHDPLCRNNTDRRCSANAKRRCVKPQKLDAALNVSVRQIPRLLFGSSRDSLDIGDILLNIVNDPLELKRGLDGEIGRA